jgi:hypothetical protein
MDYKEIFKKANDAAQVLAMAECGSDVMIYPCGFGWVYLNNGIKGKRNPLGKQLENAGLFTYDPFKRVYYYWVGGYNQSMLHKEAHAKYMAQILTEKIGEKFEFGSRMD